MEWKRIIIWVLGGLFAACGYWLVVPSSDLREGKAVSHDERAISRNDNQRRAVAEPHGDGQKNTQETAQPRERHVDTAVTNGASTDTWLNAGKPPRLTEAATGILKAPASGKGLAITGFSGGQEVSPTSESTATNRDIEIAWQDVADLDKTIDELYVELQDAEKAFLNAQTDFERGLIDEATLRQKQEGLEQLETNIQNAKAMREIKFVRIEDYEKNSTQN